MGSIGRRMLADAEDIVSGDFLTIDGYRCAVLVEQRPFQPRGPRGKPAVCGAALVTYANETTVSLEHGALHPKTHQPQQYVIYRHTEGEPHADV